MDNKTKAKNRLGEKFVTNEGLLVEIIEYFNSTNCTIRYEDGTILKNKIYQKLKAGNVKNPYHKSVFNIGYIGEGNYSTSNNSKHTIIYECWTSMLRRCYDIEFHRKYETYKDCTVCKEWHNFQNFAKWYDENYIEGYCLDKDILLKGNKLYSPETCCFVPQEINKLFQKSDKTRGNYPLGVRRNGNSLQASIQIKGKFKYLGAYTNINDAFYSYKKVKENYIKEMANKFKDTISLRVYNSLINYQVEITD